MIYFYVLLLVLSLVGETFSYKNKIRLLVLFCVVLAWGAGTRVDWPDQGAYRMSFLDYTPTIFEWSLSDVPFAYREKGFFFLGVLCKTFTTNDIIYFSVISVITFYFLFKDLRLYSVAYPLIGLCVYVARFFTGRNLMQIRAGLCYAILLLCVQYVAKRDWKRYFLFVFIAYFFHSSALIAVPLYFIPYMRLNKIRIVLLLALAFLITLFFTPFLQSFIVDTGTDLTESISGLDSYLTETEQARAMGLRNPMIYFQTVLLLLYTFNEKRFRKNLYYYLIRDAYFYSTFVLITFSMFYVLSARTSTLFATFEFVIIPSMIDVLGKKQKIVAFVGVALILTAIMAMNLGRRAFVMPVF